MNIQFINSSVRSVKYRGSEVVNNPVNISLCKSIEKSKYNYYPDNEGIPAITFNGCDVEWVYSNKEDRDSDFELIAKNKWMK